MKKLLILFGLLLPILLNAQTSAPLKQWDKTFGGSGLETFTTIKQTADGGFIMGGWSDSGQSGDKTVPAKGSNDYWVVKTDANGSKQWDISFGGSADDELHTILQTTDGGYILGGSSSSGVSTDKSQGNRGSADYWVIKLDGNGTKVWDKTYGGLSGDELYAICQTPDGGYILGGSSNSGLSSDKSAPSKGLQDFWIIKINANGNKIWDKTFGGAGYDDLFTLNLTSDGGYILIGNTESSQSGDKSDPSFGNYDYWILKLDASGTKLWDKTFGGTSYDTGYDIRQTSDGGYIVGGISTSGISGNKTQANKGSQDIWIFKLNSSGNMVWDKTLGGTDDDFMYNIIVTLDGGYFIGGNSTSGVGGDKSEPNIGNHDDWIIKTDNLGNKQWDKTYGGTDLDFISSLQQTSDGGFILGGGSLSNQSADKSQNSRGNRDFWIIKLAGYLTGISENNASGYFLSQNIPNPFNQNTTISFTLPKPETVEFTIFNSLGKTVAKMQKNYSAGENNLNWQDLQETKNLSAGTYFYQLNAGNFSSTKQLILLKQ